MRERWRRVVGDGRDRGEGMIEYVGVVVVAALLITTSIGAVAFAPGYAGDAACRIISALSGGDGAGCGDSEPIPEAADDMDFHPGVCMLSETSESYNAEVKIWFFKLSDSSGFIVQEFSDGTVRATLTDGAGLGVGGSVGSRTFDAGKLGDGDNAGFDVNLGANLKFEYGSTWQFDDYAQWQSMESNLNDYLAQQISLQNDRYGGYALYLALSGGFLDPPKDPSLTYSKISLEAALNANAGTRLPGLSKDSDGNDTYIDPKLGINGSLTAGGSVIVQRNRDTGEESHTYELSGRATLGGSMIVGHATGEGAVSGAFTTTYGPDGELTEIALKSSYEIGGSAHLGNDTFKAVSGKLGEGETRSVVTTTTLAVTDENRAQVQEWMAGNATGQTLRLPFGAMVPDQPSDDPFMQLMYEQATMSRIQYHNVEDTQEFGIAVKKGWEFGFNISATEATATKTEAEFLGAPGQDGTRTLVDDALCN